MAGNNRIGVTEGSPETATHLPRQAFNLKSLWTGLLRHRIPIALITAAVTAAAILYVLMATPMYKASASVLIETQNANPQHYQTQVEILRSRHLATRAAYRLNLWNQAEFASGSEKGSVMSTEEKARIVERFMSRIDIVPVKETRFINIQFDATDPMLASRGANALGDQYIASLKTKDAPADGGLEITKASIADRAVPPASPFKPRKALIVGVAALSALILSMLVSMLFERFNKTIRGARDVESVLGVKLLGITPVIKSGVFSAGNRLPITPLETVGRDAAFLESIDSITAQMHSSGILDKSKVILITSSEPGEGKSTVAINLAYSLAQEERVLLLDCDLRRPSVAAALKLDPRKPGLTLVLEDLNAISRVLVRRIGNSDLDVIPAGSLPDRPIRTLMSNNLARVLLVARRHYDRIIIDSPPVHAVSDALVVSKLADACVYVGAGHSTALSQARSGLERLYGANANVAGFIVSKVDIEELSKFGEEQQFQGHFDMYGYTSRDQVKMTGVNLDAVEPVRGRTNATPEG